MRLVVSILIGLVAALGLVSSVAPSSVSGQESLPFLDVSLERIDGADWCTIRAQDASLERLLAEVAAKSGRSLGGLEHIDRATLVTAELYRRPVGQALEYVLGSVGLRHRTRRGAITVLPGITEIATQEERLDFATLAWIQAVTRFPDHPSAPTARLALGELAEVQENLPVARNHYQTLIETYPTSASVSEAHMRSGRILARQHLWNEASREFRTLADRAESSEYHAAARLGLARCLIELGNPESARYILEALDSEYPTTDRTELTSRLLTKARAYTDLGRHMEALRALDGAGEELDSLGVRESLRIRAKCLEGIGLPGEAGRAWLLYGREADDQARALAFENAARLALAEGDELGALFVCREAERLGASAGLGEFKREARRRLGFDVDDPDQPLSIADRIETAEARLASGNVDAAAAIFESLYQARGALEEIDAARVCVGWASCVDTAAGPDGNVAEAVAILAGVRASFESIEAREALDVGAAALFEKHSLFDQAIEAYRGNY